MEGNSNYTIEFRSMFDSRRITCEKSEEKVEGFNGKTFIIEPYQRGYRWQASDINRLLEDLLNYTKSAKKKNEFGDFIRGDVESPTGFNSDDFDFYCLQTTTVKPIDDDKDSYELIDGQQRITSLFIIYSVLSLVTGESNSAPYEIKYKRGSNEKDAGLEIKNLLLEEYDNKKLDNQCRDYDDNRKGNESILEWKEQYKAAIAKKATESSYSGSLIIDSHYFVEAIKATIDFCFNNTRDDLRVLRKYIKYNVFFIWYEVHDAAYETFINLNSNQIKLTNSELIKSLILSDDSIEPRRWEELEQGLSRDELWAFISGEDKATKLDLLLELNARFDEEDPFKPDEKDHWALFNWYENKLGKRDMCNGSVSADSILKKVENYYDRICEWYDDVDVYHYIGLLTEYRILGLIRCTQETLVMDIFGSFDEAADHTAFIEKLKERVRDALVEGIQDTQNRAELLIGELSYDSQDATQKQRKNIFALLWLLNVWETINSSENNEKETKRRVRTVNNRMPFSKVVGKQWSIEHIMPQTPNEDAKAEEKDVYDRLVTGIKNEAAKVPQGMDIHDISNLTLLARDDNSTISNKNLHEKREMLIGRIGEGSYVPPATINAFLLYYNKDAKGSSQASPSNDEKYWTEYNAGNYGKRILECLKNIGFGG